MEAVPESGAAKSSRDRMLRGTGPVHSSACNDWTTSFTCGPTGLTARRGPAGGQAIRNSSDHGREAWLVSAGFGSTIPDWWLGESIRYGWSRNRRTRPLLDPESRTPSRRAAEPPASRETAMVQSRRIGTHARGFVIDSTGTGSVKQREFAGEMSSMRDHISHDEEEKGDFPGSIEKVKHFVGLDPARHDHGHCVSSQTAPTV